MPATRSPSSSSTCHHRAASRAPSSNVARSRPRACSMRATSSISAIAASRCCTFPGTRAEHRAVGAIHGDPVLRRRDLRRSAARRARRLRHRCVPLDDAPAPGVAGHDRARRPRAQLRPRTTRRALRRVPSRFAASELGATRCRSRARRASPRSCSHAGTGDRARRSPTRRRSGPNPRRSATPPTVRRAPSRDRSL